MQKIILVGGDAGKGIARTSAFIGKAFTEMGYYVFNYRDYPSLISGGHNFNILKISDKPVYSHELSWDIILALDQDTIEKHEKDLQKDGFILGNKELKAKNLVGIDIGDILEKINAAPIMGNNVLIGCLFRIFGLPLSSLLKSVENEFGEKSDAVKKAVEEGYNLVEQKIKFAEPKKGVNYFVSGNEAIASGAIAAGLDTYIAYPMTPATAVLHFLAAEQIKHNLLAIQLENEIAVVNAALGASYAGAMTMVGTSGGGFDLMTEAISLQGISEIPLVVYLAQRTGPSTGVPTYSTQSDLKCAVNAGHGEFPRIVIAPGDAKEAFYRTIEAFELAYKYRTISIILGDKHLGESNYSFDKFEEPLVKPSRHILKKVPVNYKSYLITKDGVSPRAVPGQGPFVRATSYEHDEYGHTIEDAEGTINMNDKRFRKVKEIEKEISKLGPVKTYGKGKNLIISWGSTKGSIIDALNELDNFRFMQISYITPFPAEVVKKEIKNSKKVVLVENNVTGLLGQIIAEQTGCVIDKKVLKYDSRPFTSQDVVDGVKKVIK